LRLVSVQRDEKVIMFGELEMSREEVVVADLKAFGWSETCANISEEDQKNL